MQRAKSDRLAPGEVPHPSQATIASYAAHAFDETATVDQPWIEPRWRHPHRGPSPMVKRPSKLGPRRRLARSLAACGFFARTLMSMLLLSGSTPQRPENPDCRMWATTSWRSTSVPVFGISTTGHGGLPARLAIDRKVNGLSARAPRMWSPLRWEAIASPKGGMKGRLRLRDMA